MKYFLIVGEASGDIHAASLIRAIRQKDAKASFCAWGGDYMQAEGISVVKHIKELSFFGIWQILMNIRTILHNFKQCKQDILQFQPDVVIGVDYPGFNLKMLAWSKRHHFKTILYVLPHVWAWRAGRVKTIKKYCDHVLTILPFEVNYCKEKKIKSTYIGNPVAEHVQHFKTTLKAPPSRDFILLMPGSRPSELNHILSIMLEVTRHFPDEKFKILRAQNLDTHYYEPYLKAYPHVDLVSGNSFEWMHSAKAGIIKSGTSTLEAALMNLPFLVVYRFNLFNALLGFLLIKFKYIALPNLILDKLAVVELIQYRFNVMTTKAELEKLLYDVPYRKNMLNDFSALQSSLILDENPSDLAASCIIKEMNTP